MTRSPLKHARWSEDLAIIVRGNSGETEGTAGTNLFESQKDLLYCFAHDGWNVTGYQGLSCPLNKPSCDRLPGCVQVVKAGGRRVFVVEIGHFYMKKQG